GRSCRAGLAFTEQGGRSFGGAIRADIFSWRRPDAGRVGAGDRSGDVGGGGQGSQQARVFLGNPGLILFGFNLELLRRELGSFRLAQGGPFLRTILFLQFEALNGLAIGDRVGGGFEFELEARAFVEGFRHRGELFAVGRREFSGTGGKLLVADLFAFAAEQTTQRGERRSDDLGDDS